MARLPQFDFERFATILAPVKRVGRFAGRIVFPPTCPGCHCIIADMGGLCADCWAATRFIEEPMCSVLGIPFSHDLGPNIISADAIANPPVFGKLRAAVFYEGVARKMVGALKYRDRTDLAPWMANWMCRAGADILADRPAVVPVPLHRWRHLQRRFNQSGELARHVSSQRQLTFLPDALVRIRQTRQQVGLSQQERRKNVHGAFKVPGAKVSQVDGRNLVLIDDVYTTGATVSAAAKTLLASGANSVDVLTFARVATGDFQSEGLETI